MADTLEQSRELREEADRLLVETGLPDLLREYGSLHPTGSYHYDLMTWRDIDFCLVLDEVCPEKVLEIGQRVSVLPYVGSMYFRNELVMRTEGNPRAIFLCVDFYVPEGDPWKVDVLVAHAEEVERVLALGREVLDRLTPGTREAILTIKGELCRRPGYRREFSSKTVYRAVLDHGIRTVDEWDAWFTDGAAADDES